MNKIKSKRKPILNKGSKRQKEPKILEKVESFLLGLIIFFGKYFWTLWHVLFHFSNIKTVVSGDFKSIDHNKHLRPLTYLFTSILFFLFIYSKTFLFIDKFFLQDKEIVGLFKKTVKYIIDFKANETLYLIAPFILIVAFLAMLSSIVSRIWTKKSSFELQLYLDSYIFGTAFFIIGNLSGIGLIYGKQIIEDNTTVSQEIFIITAIVIAVFLLILLVYRYLALLKKSLSISWIHAFFIVGILITIITFGYFILDNL